MIKRIAIVLPLLFFLILGFSPKTFASDINDLEVSVYVAAKFNDPDATIEIFNGLLVYGTEYTVLFDDVPEDFSFAYWMVNGVLRLDLTEVDSTFVVTNGLTIEAIFTDIDEHVVFFVEPNMTLLQRTFVATGNSIEFINNVMDKLGYEFIEDQWLI